MYVTCMSVCACVRICYSACLYVSHCTFHAFKKNKCNMFEYVFYRCINQKYCIHFYAILRVYLSSQLYEFHPLNIAILDSMKFKLWIFDYFMSKNQEIYFKSFLCTYIHKLCYKVSWISRQYLLFWDVDPTFLKTFKNV